MMAGIFNERLVIAMGPKYRMVYNEILDRIKSGALKPDDKIPSTADLCTEFGVSATVVNQAVLLLVNDGHIFGQPGLGRYVAQR